MKLYKVMRVFFWDLEGLTVGGTEINTICYSVARWWSETTHFEDPVGLKNLNSKTYGFS